MSKEILEGIRLLESNGSKKIPRICAIISFARATIPMIPGWSSGADNASDVTYSTGIAYS